MIRGWNTAWLLRTAAKYLLNNADLVNLPAGEGVEVEISELGKSAELTVYPLDHFGSDVWRRVKIENQ